MALPKAPDRSTSRRGNGVPGCEGCQYNTARAAGGKGLICNGYTKREFGRCPEWRLHELQG